MKPPRAFSLPALILAALASTASAQVWEHGSVLYELRGESSSDAFGWSVRSAGLVDGDSAPDLVVGAPSFASNRGKVYVYSGATGALLWDFVGAPTESLGSSVGTAGDLNGDSISEVLAGAPAGAGMPGRVIVLDGATGSVLRTLMAGETGDRFGTEVASTGDIDGDGVPEILVGAWLASAINRGRVYVMSGATGSVLREHTGLSSGSQMGSALGSIGDRDGDGVEDYVVCAEREGAGERGAAFVHDGASGQLLTRLDPLPSDGDFGRHAAGHAGDVDADGTPDFFVSFDAGAYVYSGADFARLKVLRGGGGYGRGNGFAGDFDQDGHDDLFFSAPVSSLGQGTGVVSSGADGRAIATFHGDSTQTGLGFDSAGLGDVDGDGAIDFALSSPNTASVLVLSGGADVPRRYCETAPNSVGDGARLSYERSVRISDNAFRLRVDGAPAGRLGVFFYGDRAVQIPFGDGVRCVGGRTFRLTPPISTTGPLGLVRRLDFTRGQPASGPGQITNGSTWYFQFMYRDPLGPGGTSANTTDGLQVTFFD